MGLWIFFIVLLIVLAVVFVYFETQKPVSQEIKDLIRECDKQGGHIAFVNSAYMDYTCANLSHTLFAGKFEDSRKYGELK